MPARLSSRSGLYVMSTEEPDKLGAKPLPFPRFCKIPIPFLWWFSKASMENLKIGICPQAMEDHWSSTFRDSGLEIFRSWTGGPVYRVPIVSFRGGGIAFGAWITFSLKSRLGSLIVLPVLLLLLPFLIHRAASARQAAT